MTGTDHITRHRGPTRFLLLALGLTQLTLGLYALLDSSGFYHDFPLGRGWVAADGPYNQHLLTDFGGLYLETAVLALWAAISLRRRFVQVTALAYLAFAVPHFVYHALNLEPYSTGDAIANVLSLGSEIVAPPLLLVLAREARPRRREAVAAGNGRIAGVPAGRAGLLVRYVYRETRRKTGKMVEPIAVTAHSPLLLMGYGAFELAVERADRLDARLKAMGALKAATMTGCDFCIDIGSKLGRDHGMSERQVREFLFYRESDAFSPLERLVIDYAAGMSKTPVDVPDELFAQLREHLDEAQLVELTAEIALENYRGRFNKAFGLGSEGFSQGGATAEPEPATA